MAESILSTLDGGVEFNDSSVGRTEHAGDMIRQGVELQCTSPCRYLEVHRVCDNDLQCRHVLRCHAAEREHCKHSFSDICDRSDPSSLAALLITASRQRGAHALEKGCFRECVLVKPWWRKCA